MARRNNVQHTAVPMDKWKRAQQTFLYCVLSFLAKHLLPGHGPKMVSESKCIYTMRIVHSFALRCMLYLLSYCLHFLNDDDDDSVLRYT